MSKFYLDEGVKVLPSIGKIVVGLDVFDTGNDDFNEIYVKNDEK